MKHKKLIAIVTLLLFAITLFPTAAFAATPGTKVTATIPTFKVTMNGQVVDNTYRQYPFLVYNDITYFPMTYWDMRFLGVSNTWSAETGSVIVADGTSSEYKPTLTDVKNKTKNTAVVNTGAFKVNGKVIDNAKEEYPILSFRDVPYFPLTWSWCQEFGWNINFDGANGLAVNTTKQTPSKNVNNEPETSNTTKTYKITADELAFGVWLATHEKGFEFINFNDYSEYSDEAKEDLKYNGVVYDGIYNYEIRNIDNSQMTGFLRAGYYLFKDNVLTLVQIGETDLTLVPKNADSIPFHDTEEKTISYNVSCKTQDGKLYMQLNNSAYLNLSEDEANDLYNELLNKLEAQADPASIIYAITEYELSSGCWVADNTNSFEFWTFNVDETYRMDKNSDVTENFDAYENNYRYGRITLDNSDTTVQSSSTIDGSFVFSEDSLILRQEKEHNSIQKISGETSTNDNYEEQISSHTLAIAMKDGKLTLYIDGRPYYKMSRTEAQKVLEARVEQMNEQAASIIASKKPNSADYAYLAGDDFKRIQSKYSTAEAQYAYVYAYENIDGDLCVLTNLRYKIINNYDAFTLHNITTGETISAPDDYYKNIMNRYYGATRLYYGDLYSEVLDNKIKMMQAGIDILKTGNNTFDGVFVDAKTLNLGS